MKNNPSCQKRLAQAIIATMMIGWGAHASANDFALVNNGLTISVNDDVIANATLTNTGADATASGILTTPSLPQVVVNSASLSTSIPTFSFDLALPAGIVPGSHTFRVGLVIVDEANPANRRFEAYINNLVLNVAAGGTVTGTIGAQDMFVAARRGVSAFSTALTNESPNGPVSVNGGNITLSGARAVNVLRARNNSAINAILDDFALTGTFTFRVIVEQVSKTGTPLPDDARLVLANGTALSTINGGTLFSLMNNPFGASSFAIQGRFQAVSGTVTPPPGTVPPATITDMTTAANDFAQQVAAGNLSAAVNALTSVSGNINSIANSVQGGATLTAAQTTAVQSAVAAVLDNASALLTAAGSDSETFTSAVNTLIQILEDMKRALVPATDDSLIEKVQTAGVAVVNAVVENNLTALGLQPGASNAQIRAALENNRAVLDAVLEAALPIPPFVVESQAAVNARIQSNLPDGAPPSLGAKLGQIVSSTVLDPDAFRVGGMTVGEMLRNLFSGSTTALTINDERNGAVSAATVGEVGIVSDPVSGVVKITLPDESYAGMISSVKAVAESVPPGISFRRNGSALIVTNSVAIELSPISLDLIAFAAAVEGAGYDFDLRSDGSLSFDLGQGNRFGGVFAYDNLTGQDLSTCGTLSIVDPTGEETSAQYAFGVNCSSGIQQRVVPYIENANFFASLDANNIPYSVDRNTGIITSEGNGRFKPGFFVSPRTSAETSFHTANANAQGIAFEAVDVNGDGRMDFKVISASGTQILFGVN
ncbi:MAG: hypothetical protein Q8K97_10400 [Pseudohongiella sp.]|nr:hypothetical protein [Pseudohongiella sp.]